MLLLLLLGGKGGLSLLRLRLRLREEALSAAAADAVPLLAFRSLSLCLRSSLCRLLPGLLLLLLLRLQDSMPVLNRAIRDKAIHCGGAQAVHDACNYTAIQKYAKHTLAVCCWYRRCVSACYHGLYHPLCLVWTCSCHHRGLYHCDHDLSCRSCCRALCCLLAGAPCVLDF
jgi:hypothetical protein